MARGLTFHADRSMGSKKVLSTTWEDGGIRAGLSCCCLLFVVIVVVLVAVVVFMGLIV